MLPIFPAEFAYIKKYYSTAEEQKELLASFTVNFKSMLLHSGTIFCLLV
jgi:hypothetical protein